MVSMNLFLKTGSLNNHDTGKSRGCYVLLCLDVLQLE